MILQSSSARELSAQLAEAAQPVSAVNLRAMGRVIEHTPEDMSATVEAGVSLADFQTLLAQAGQWLPLDPPNAAQLTIGEMLASNASGPRRFGYGTARDWVIGLKVVLADGRVVQSGGKVVKNVAGYDLAKLFIGGHGSLGIIVEATFKLRPRPGRESFAEVLCESADIATRRLEAALESDLTPIVMDLHNLGSAGGFPWRMVVGFAGDLADVEWQLTKGRELGLVDTSSLDHENQFWARGTAEKLSVLPSKTIELARAINGPFVARAGNGILYHRDPALAPKKAPSSDLARRLKDAFDPKNILPELPA